MLSNVVKSKSRSKESLQVNLNHQPSHRLLHRAIPRERYFTSRIVQGSTEQLQSQRLVQGAKEGQFWEIVRASEL